MEAAMDTAEGSEAPLPTFPPDKPPPVEKDAGEENPSAQPQDVPSNKRDEEKDKGKVCMYGRRQFPIEVVIQCNF